MVDANGDINGITICEIPTDDDVKVCKWKDAVAFIDGWSVGDSGETPIATFSHTPAPPAPAPESE